MKPMSSRRGVACMVCGGLLLSALGVFLEQAGQPPLVAVWARCAFGCAMLTVVLGIQGQLRTLRLSGGPLVAAVSCGVLILLMWWLFFQSIQRTSIGFATVVFHVQPFMVMALGAWWLHERVWPVQWVATGVAVVGLTLVAELPRVLAGKDTIDSGTALGLVMCLGAASTYALVVLIAKRVQTMPAGRANAKRRAAPGPLVLVWWQCVIGTVILSWWPLHFTVPTELQTWAWLTGLGVLSTGLAYTLLYAGIAVLSTGRIALLQFIYPLAAVAVDAIVYGRKLDLMQLAGLVLMLIALFVAMVQPRRTIPAPDTVSIGTRQ